MRFGMLLVITLALAGFQDPIALASLARAEVRAPQALATPIPSFEIQRQVDDALQATWKEFGPSGLQSNQVAVTAVLIRDQQPPAQGHYRGNEPIYPASVIKLFYLVATHAWLHQGRTADTPELRRALRDMIVDSYNEATHYIVDVLTGTTSGPELNDAELEAWHSKRNSINRYLHSLGFPSTVNANKKPWCEGPYGRETQAIRAFQPNRNLLTTDATARLLTAIARREVISSSRCEEMLALMARDPWDPQDKDPDSQARFTGTAFPRGTRLWSKAGWTSQTRHDAAYAELPNGTRLVLVIFTEGHANNRSILPFIAGRIVASLAERPAPHRAE